MCLRNSFMQDCISAISTANGTGGVAIIRISGSSALNIALKMFKPSGNVKEFMPNYMYAGTILGDGFSDYGFMVYFAAPKSFTGENTVEFHCHGGVQIARGILSKTLSLGARAADRGEFTKRAFLNGKLTLSSAEGMIDMINAESLALVRAGNMLYTEKLSAEVKKIQSSLTDVLAAIAAELDYPEEDLDGLDFEKIKCDLIVLNEQISALVKSYSSGKKIKSGVLVAICGKPNAGKSSLLNALLGYDKAIVSDEAGTTRDVVEGAIEIDGIIYNLIDTAGIRERAGAIEKMGIERTKNAIRSADLVLFLTDGTDLPPNGINGKVISVFNKSDIAEPNGKYDISISAKTGDGLGELKKLMSSCAVGESSLDKTYIVEERHYDALTRAYAAVNNVIQNIDYLTPDLVSVDLKEAWEALGEITGEAANEQIINAVFAKFCVGK